MWNYKLMLTFFTHDILSQSFINIDLQIHCLRGMLNRVNHCLLHSVVMQNRKLQYHRR